MLRIILAITCAAGLVAVASQARGGDSCDLHAKVTCPRCQQCCTLDVKSETEEKSCWEVKCEQICIPRVVFPWQNRKALRHGGCADCSARCDDCDSGCDACVGKCGKCSVVHNGARVRTVRKLHKRTYECPTCKYEWTPASCGSGGCDSGCDYRALPDGTPQAPRTMDKSPMAEINVMPIVPPAESGGDRERLVTRRSLTDR
jgi:hypothetical protein